MYNAQKYIKHKMAKWHFRPNFVISILNKTERSKLFQLILMRDFRKAKLEFIEYY